MTNGFDFIKAKVGEARCKVLFQQHVAELQIVMENLFGSQAVQVFERFGDAECDFQLVDPRELLVGVGDEHGERGRHKLVHDEQVLYSGGAADERREVFVRQLCDARQFGAKVEQQRLFRSLLEQFFDGDRRVGVVAEKHFAVRAEADAVALVELDVVSRHDVAGREHCRRLAVGKLARRQLFRQHVAQRLARRHAFRLRLGQLLDEWRALRLTERRQFRLELVKHGFRHDDLAAVRVAANFVRVLDHLAHKVDATGELVAHVLRHAQVYGRAGARSAEQRRRLFALFLFFLAARGDVGRRRLVVGRRRQHGAALGQFQHGVRPVGVDQLQLRLETELGGAHRVGEDGGEHGAIARAAHLVAAVHGHERAQLGVVQHERVAHRRGRRRPQIGGGGHVARHHRHFGARRGRRHSRVE
mmetsp:Transcript_2126/g.3521  ORF Transcript_2126/g.3521 Transcript_2126/m.3521 type:complete len:416 (-) Transcript_2126:126-1373(-)